MASEAPSWADQWGAGGIGAMEEDDTKTNRETGDNKKKAASSARLAKAAAVVGAHKFKNGISMSIKWVKNKFQKKSPPKGIEQPTSSTA